MIDKSLGTDTVQYIVEKERKIPNYIAITLYIDDNNNHNTNNNKQIWWAKLVTQ